MSVVSKDKPLNHYQWGNHCDGCNLVEENTLSVKWERMPPHTSEQRHFHEKAQQFFFILKGEAAFEIEQERIIVKKEEGIHIPTGKHHRIINEGNVDLEFLLSSQPSTIGDRFHVD